MYYVYAIKNLNIGNLYIGYTKNLKRRLKEHKNKKPELIYCEAYKSEVDAREREKKLKQYGQGYPRIEGETKKTASQSKLCAGCSLLQPLWLRYK